MPLIHAKSKGKTMDRRKFLKGSLGLGALIATPTLGACGDDGEPTTPGGVPPEIVDPAHRILKGPWVQLIGPHEASLRFESRWERDFDVIVERASGTQTHRATPNPVELDYARPALGKDAIPDERGRHILYELTFSNLEPGERVRWTLSGEDELPEEVALSGEFLAPVAPGSAFRFGWIADTMYPTGDAPLARLIAEAPDVVLHGGDLVYDTNPLDSWNGVMTKYRGIGKIAAMHVIPGNHEHEAQDEFEIQFKRLFAGQGSPGGATRYFSFTYGHVLFIGLDSEAGELNDLDSEQMQWLVQRLEDANADDSIGEIIVGFHRPLFTLSDDAPGNTSVRDTLHPLFLAHGVRLVFSGHVHSYERFNVDGITYIVDGGGGALLYNPSAKLEQLQETRPADVAARQFVSQSTGVCIIDFDTDGSFVLQRFLDTGEVLDTVEFPAPT